MGTKMLPVRRNTFTAQIFLSALPEKAAGLVQPVRFKVSFGGETWNPLSGDQSTSVLLLRRAIIDPVFSRDDSGNHVEGFIR